MGNLIAADTRNRTGWNSVERWPIRVAGRAQRPWVCLVIGGWLKKSVGWIAFWFPRPIDHVWSDSGRWYNSNNFQSSWSACPYSTLTTIFCRIRWSPCLPHHLIWDCFLFPVSLFFSPNESLDYVLGEPRRRAFRFIDSIRPIFSICFSFRFTIKQTGECVQYIYFFTNNFHV